MPHQKALKYPPELPIVLNLEDKDLVLQVVTLVLGLRNSILN